MEVRARHPIVARPGGIALLIGGIIGWIFVVGGVFPEAAVAGPVPAAIAGIVWTLPCLLGPLLGSTTATAWIGADGITVRSFWRVRFIAYRDVEDYRIDPDRIALRLRNGKYFYLQITTRGRYVRPLPHLDHPASEIIRAGVAASRADRTPSPEEHELARGERDERAWLQAIDAHAKEDAEYRRAPIDRDELARLSADPHADPSVRAASALVLRKAGLRVEERETLRAAASTTAHPKVRVVLEEAADDEVAEVALAENVARVR